MKDDELFDLSRRTSLITIRERLGISLEEARERLHEAEARFLTVERIAEDLSLGYQTVLRLVRSGHIRAHKLNKRWIVERSAVEEFLEKTNPRLAVVRDRVGTMGTLTIRQREVMITLANEIRESGVPPTYSELCKILGFASKNALSEHVGVLVNCGLLMKETRQPRGIAPTPTGWVIVQGWWSAEVDPL